MAEPKPAGKPVAKTWRSRLMGLAGFGQGALPSVLSVLLSLVVCFVAIALMRQNVFDVLGRIFRGEVAAGLSELPGVLARNAVIAGQAYAQMIWGGLGDLPAFLEGGNWSLLARPLGESAAKAALLTLTGLSVAVAFAAGLFNIGAQGQMLVGAICAAVLGAHLPLPPGLHPAACILAAALAGGLYGLLPAVLKLRRGVHEVISTIMLNWVAVSLIENWLVTGPLRATATSGTDEILETAQLPRLLGGISRLHLGFPLAMLIAFGVWLWLLRTRFGFETRAIGLGPEAARASGIPVHARMYQAMGLSGALAGAAGAFLVLGTEYKFPATLGAPYGFDGIAISLIGQNHPLGVALSAIVFGILRAGGTRMQLLGVHKSFPELIQGLALLFVAGKLIWELVIVRLRRKPAVPASEVQRA